MLPLAARFAAHKQAFQKEGGNAKGNYASEVQFQTKAKPSTSSDSVLAEMIEISLDSILKKTC